MINQTIEETNKSPDKIPLSNSFRGTFKKIVISASELHFK